MTRTAKIIIVCPIEIDDEADITEALYKAVLDDLTYTDQLNRFEGLAIEDKGEWTNETNDF